MTSPKTPPGQCPDADPSMMTRSEVLRDALKARRTPEPDREFSTLVQRSECPPGCQPVGTHGGVIHAWGCWGWTREHDELAAGYERLLKAVESYIETSPSVIAGATDSNRDEAEYEHGAEPDPPACAQEDQHDAAQQ